MNKKHVAINLAIIAIIIVGSVTVNYTSNAKADWMGSKKAEPNVDVYQETCGPVLLPSSITCQQANYIIKQNAELIKLAGGK